MDPSYYSETQVARILMEVEIGALGEGCLSLNKAHLCWDFAHHIWKGKYGGRVAW